MFHPQRCCLLILAISALTLAGCHPLRPKAVRPDNSFSSGVAIAIEQKNLLDISYVPDRVLFVRLKDGEKIEDVTGSSFFFRGVASNYNDGKYIYLLNATPGRYVAIGSYYRAPNRKAGALFYFPAELVHASEIRVEGGQIGFMGKYVASASSSLDDADELQKRFFRELKPNDAAMSGAMRVIAGREPNFLSIEEQYPPEESEIEFLNAASVTVGKTGWSPALDRRRALVKSRAPKPEHAATVAASPHPSPSTDGKRHVAVLTPLWAHNTKTARSSEGIDRDMQDTIALACETRNCRISQSVVRTDGVETIPDARKIAKLLWQSGGFFSGPVADDAYLAQKARELGVDLIATWKVEGGFGGTMTPVLFSARSGKSTTETLRFDPGWQQEAQKDFGKMLDRMGG